MTSQTQRNDEINQRITELSSQIGRLATLLGMSVPAIEAPAAPRADTVPAGSVEITLGMRLNATLRSQMLTLDEIAETFGMPASAVLHEVRNTPGIVNVGSELRPVYSALLGDEGETSELIEKVEALISLRPMAATEIEAATGARRNRIRGALNRIQLRRKVQNHGTPAAALWFAPPAPKSKR